MKRGCFIWGSSRNKELVPAEGAAREGKDGSCPSRPKYFNDSVNVEIYVFLELTQEGATGYGLLPPRTFF